MLPRVALQRLNGMVSDGDGGVVAVALLDSREPLIIQQVRGGSEKPVLIHQAIGVVEARSSDRFQADVPLAGMVGAVAERLQILGDEPCPGWDIAWGHDVAGGLLRV